MIKAILTDEVKKAHKDLNKTIKTTIADEVKQRVAMHKFEQKNATYLGWIVSLAIVLSHSMHGGTHSLLEAVSVHVNLKLLNSILFSPKPRAIFNASWGVSIIFGRDFWNPWRIRGGDTVAEVLVELDGLDS